MKLLASVFAAFVALANGAMEKPSIQAQLDEMREIINAQALRIEELEAVSIPLLQRQERRQAEQHSRRLGLQLDDYDSFDGVRVKSDDAVVTLGEKSDVALVRTGKAKASFVGDISFEGSVSGELSTDTVLASDLTASGKVTASSVNVKGGIRLTDDLVLSGPNRKDPGTVGYTYGAGVLNPGQSSPENYVNPNSWSGNGKISITICSMHTEGEASDGTLNSDGTVNSHHVYKVYWNAHGQGYNDYSDLLLERLKDGDLVLEANRDIKKFGNPAKDATGFDASGCVFRNKHKTQKAFWIIKQLPITTFISTRHAAMKTGPWSI